MDIDIPLYMTGSPVLDVVLGVLIGLGTFQLMTNYLNSLGEKN